MTADWDFYPLRIDDKLASIYLDLGQHAGAPDAQLPHVAYISLRMRTPREDGLSGQAEFDALNAIEDSLQAALNSDGMRYVGRCTTDGRRDFFFYIAQPDTWPQQASDAMQSFPAYAYKAGTRPDADWSTYLSFLYPSARDVQGIQDRRVCQALEQRGDNLEQAREIDHWAYFPSASARDGFVAAAQPQGFAIRATSEPTAEDGGYGAQLWRADIPSYRGIGHITMPLFHLATEHGGRYAGWECVVIGPAVEPAD